MKKAQRKPVFWFRARDDRRRWWRFYLSTPEITPGLGKNSDGAEDHGYTDFERRRVFINANNPRRKWPVSAAHELSHVSLVDTALEYKETFIEVHAVHQLPILMSLGFRFPNPPRVLWR